MQTVAAAPAGTAVDGAAPPPGGTAAEDDGLLVAGALVAAQLRHTIKEKLGYTLSAGVAHNKMLAKHASGMHKPFQQTVVRTIAITELMTSLKLDELNGFGGKKGKELEEQHGIHYVADLQKYSLKQLQGMFGEVQFAQTTFDGCRGICYKEVKQKVFMSK